MQQQELIKKKREIIDVCLKNGVLISSDVLKEIDDTCVPKILELLKIKQISEDGIVNLDLNKLIEYTKREKEQNLNHENLNQEAAIKEPKVKILYSSIDEPKKREPQDFIDYFNTRYKSIEKILKQHRELNGTISISKTLNRQGKEQQNESVSIIGMVSEKQTTKNGNLMLLLEDPTGRRKVIVNKSKPSLYNEAKDIVHDEVIGVVGVDTGTMIFANSIVWPDTPSSKDLKKSDEEKYALFLSDMHVGSAKFLPEDFERFLKWINGDLGNEQQRHIAKNVDYIFIAGDLVDGCGIYPDQDKELSIKDIYDQYIECARLLRQIPGHIPLIICPGNHDAIRISEPQPLLSKNFAKPIYELNNAIMVSNPSLINIASSEGFAGFDVLMYHGYSFDYFVAQVDSLRSHGGYDRADLIMRFLLKRRHLAPTHISTLYVPNPKKDALVIESVPDFFLSGHIHKSITANFRNTTLICGSCWQSKTGFQEKVGHNPEPSRVPIVNLQTRDVKILKFGH